MTIVIRSRRVLTDRGLAPASIHILDGIIASVAPYDTDAGDSPVHDAGDDIVMPGLVDTHVHVNEPGRTLWEGFASATRAAAAGGVTTLFDMPLNSIPATTSRAALYAKQQSARGRVTVNVGFIGGVVPGNAHELPALHDTGARMFKCFLVPSGVEEFPCVTESDLRDALPVLAKLGAPLLVHAELPEYIVAVPQGDPRRYATYLASRPAAAETEAVALVVRLAEEFGAPVHIVHVSSHLSLPIIRAARARGVSITCETCPHYLSFAAEDIADRRTEFKCAPPIRDANNREALWRGILDGDVDLIASDHSPCPPDMKSPDDGDFLRAWGGIASLQLGLPAVWTQARHRGAGPEVLARLMSAAPARLAGIGHRKGGIAPGLDADIVIWNPDLPVNVDAITLYHRHPLTPYRGLALTGAVQATYVAGVAVYRDGRVTDDLPGRLIS